jgi:hypothetical protein
MAQVVLSTNELSNVKRKVIHMVSLLLNDGAQVKQLKPEDCDLGSRVRWIGC